MGEERNYAKARERSCRGKNVMRFLKRKKKTINYDGNKLASDKIAAETTIFCPKCAKEITKKEAVFNSLLDRLGFSVECGGCKWTGIIFPNNLRSYAATINKGKIPLTIKR